MWSDVGHRVDHQDDEDHQHRDQHALRVAEVRDHGVAVVVLDDDRGRGRNEGEGVDDRRREQHSAGRQTGRRADEVNDTGGDDDRDQDVEQDHERSPMPPDASSLLMSSRACGPTAR